MKKSLILLIVGLIGLIMTGCSAASRSATVAAGISATQTAVSAVSKNQVATATPTYVDVEHRSQSFAIKSTPVPTVGELFHSPVSTTKTFNSESAWIIAEPGVLLDATATFDRGSTSGEHFLQIPEGGFTYLSAGGGNLSIGDVSISLKEGNGINNLVVIRGRITDNDDTDLNITGVLRGYVAGNIISSPMPVGAYVSMDWFRQQLEVSSGVVGQSGGNCGASGCTTTFIHLFDVDAGFYQIFEVKKSNLDSWTLVYTNKPS